MSSELGFSAKVVVFFALTFGATLWLLNGAPVPVQTVKPLERNADLPTFAEVTAEAHEREAASPQTEEARQLEYAVNQLAIGSAAYRFQKCNARTREIIAEAIGNYFRLRRENPGLTVVPRKVDLPQGGFVLDEKKVESIIQRFFAKGQLTLEEFSYQTRVALEDLVTPGPVEKQQYYKKCQGLG